MSQNLPQDNNYDPYPTTWAAWLHTKEMCGKELVPQYSKFSQVFFNSADNIYYKIRTPNIAPEQAMRLKNYQVNNPTVDNEKKALDYATLLGLEVPQRYSLAINMPNTEASWQSSCLATKAISGISLKAFMQDRTISFDKKIALIHAAYTEMLSVGFAFDDGDRDNVENVFLDISPCGKKYNFKHIDFGYAFSNGKMFTQKNIFLLKQQAQTNGALKPPQAMMQNAFDSLIQRVDEQRGIIPETDRGPMLQRLQMGKEYTLAQLYL